MKFRRRIAVFVFSFFAIVSSAQDTFSILAFDSLTREVGAAGASCVDLFTTTFNNHFICELHPDTGAIACQANYLTTNQANARYRMRLGYDAVPIIDWLKQNDASGTFLSNHTNRQYGVVKMSTVSVQCAAYTGTNCMSYANHRIGPNYTIHGNILRGVEVLDSMEARFNRETGSLACKLMAAMQGANMVGADSRCTSNNSSSLFAFLKVSIPTDTFGKPRLLVSLKTKNGDLIEPIDSLQKLFDAVRTCTIDETGIQSLQSNGVLKIFIRDNFLLARIPAPLQNSTIVITDIEGRTIFNKSAPSEETRVNIETWQRGVYIAYLAGLHGRPVKFVIQ